MKNFRTLKVWEKAHALTLAIYKVTEKFPKQEMYALTTSLGVSSAESNRTRSAMVRSLSVTYATGSLCELHRGLH